MTYQDNIKEWYDAETGPVSTGEVINEWVSRKTKGHVKKLVDSGPLGAVAVLVNAIHFKGSWTTAFNKNHTRTGSFETPEGLVEANVRAVKAK